MKIIIIYSTTGGNTKLVADFIANIFQEAGLRVDIQHALMSKPQDLDDYDFVILASPTYGAGKLEPGFIPFAKALEKYDFDQKNCSIIALGDCKYDMDHCLESAKILSDLIERKNGNIAVTPLRILESPIKHLDSLVKNWAAKSIEFLKKEAVKV